uniref:CdiI_2 domain-containing protein n=1 Tax=Panagrellus redivivus TaxID=6233 RepID=A0A7E4VLK5_PANRE
MNMILSGERLSNLEGIMSLYAKVFTENNFDDDNYDWKTDFVEVFTAEFNDQIKDASAVAEGLLTNPNIKKPQYPVDGVSIEATWFSEVEVQCLELICSALLINFELK